jgi:hypothetical protein
MYTFHISPDGNTNTRLVLDNISIITDGYHLEHGKHYFNDPFTAIAYFTIKDEIYSLSNRWGLYASAEDFFDAMKYQQDFFELILPQQRYKRKDTTGNPGASA